VTVLLVDDYPDALEVWEIFLTAEGCHVITANDGEQALEIARTQRPDVIVMDFQMPGLSGPSVAEALRQNPVTAQIPLIAVTGHRLELAEARRHAGIRRLPGRPPAERLAVRQDGARARARAAKRDTDEHRYGGADDRGQHEIDQCEAAVERTGLGHRHTFGQDASSSSSNDGFWSLHSSSRLSTSSP